MKNLKIKLLFALCAILLFSAFITEKKDLITIFMIGDSNKEEKMYIMLWLEEKSYDEIAEIIGTNRNQVAVKLHRIKEKLKNMSDI